MRRKFLLIAFMIPTIIAVSGHFVYAATELGVVTHKGSVLFTVEDDWPVLGMKTKLPVAAAVFQIPDSADQGTPDSTNLVINLYQPDSEKAQSLLARFGEKLGDGEPILKSNNDWTIFKQEAKQGSTLYTIMDARKNVADVIVTVRLAWPDLSHNSSSHDQKMETIFETFLNSVRGETGLRKVREGEVIRRPERSGL